jgi:hypothetical protein
MKILAFLQNQWFKRPEVVRDIYRRNPDKYEALVARFLFMGCKTGRMLRTAFGVEMCDRIIWCEASPQIGGESSSVFPADPDHIQRLLVKHNPKVVIALGTIAANAIRNMPLLTLKFDIIIGPHPTARHPDTALQLQRIRKQLAQLTMEVAHASQK